jgi:NitT/TauT family transport system substrate-binding protein
MWSRGNPSRAGLAFLSTLAWCPIACDADPASLRLGYLPTLAHAPAIVGLERGLFARELGPDLRIEGHASAAGPDAVAALFSGALDVAYLGPNPAVNAHVRSGGQAIRVIAGAASGGTALVVRRGIRRAEDLRGLRLATPQLGNTQDVALRAWLAEQGFRVTIEGGDVEIVHLSGARAFESFRSKAIDGAWLAEPWVARMQIEAGGHVLVDEAELWPNGRFVTAQLAVRTEVLRDRPDAVMRFLRGHIRAVDFIHDEPARAMAVVNAGLARLGGRAIAPDVIRAGWARFAFTLDPLPDTLRRSAENARRAGLLDESDLTGLHVTEPLQAALRSLGRAPPAPEGP